MRKIYSRFAFTKSLAYFIIAAMFVCGITANAQTYTITFPNAPPATSNGSVNLNDPGTDGVTVGVRFRVTQPGVVTGVLFYKGTSVTGTHVGHLWSNTGTKLAEATFTEVGFGWQEVTFGTAVTVTPGNNYVASVYSADGYYASENDTWADQGGQDYGTNPIRVIAYSNDPAHNGIFVFTPSGDPDGDFPTGDGTANNYWIDLRFDPTFALPVNLSDLKTTTTMNNVAVSWKTTSETNNRGFEVQRSNNNRDWYTLNFVDGAGESTSVRSYSYTDKGLAPGIYYYRLIQKDHDGKSKISSVVTATVSGKGIISLFQNYPNPFSGSSSIRFDVPRSQKVRLSIFDMMGREVKLISDKTSEAGSHLVSFDATGLSRQIYSIRLKTESGVLTRQILVQ